MKQRRDFVQKLRKHSDILTSNADAGSQQYSEGSATEQKGDYVQ